MPSVILSMPCSTTGPVPPDSLLPTLLDVDFGLWSLLLLPVGGPQDSSVDQVSVPVCGLTPAVTWRAVHPPAVPSLRLASCCSLIKWPSESIQMLKRADPPDPHDAPTDKVIEGF